MRFSSTLESATHLKPVEMLFSSTLERATHLKSAKNNFSSTLESATHLKSVQMLYSSTLDCATHLKSVQMLYSSTLAIRTHTLAPVAAHPHSATIRTTPKNQKNDVNEQNSFINTISANPQTSNPLQTRFHQGTHFIIAPFIKQINNRTSDNDTITMTTQLTRLFRIRNTETSHHRHLAQFL